MKITDLKTLLVHELQDLYNAENQLLKALPKMHDAAHDTELKDAFASHLEETKGQVERLHEIFEHFEQGPEGTHCNAMEGLIKEGSEAIEEDCPADVKDAMLIAAAQRVEHYEIAGYGCAKAFAKRLGLNEVADLIDQTLQQEGDADKKLTQIATGEVNLAAVNG